MNRSAMVLGLGLAMLCACDPTEESSSSNAQATCAWHGNCSTVAPNGAYDCSGNTLMHCNSGQWETVAYCGSHQDARGYTCNCKGGCGTTTVECSYAFNVCDGLTYPTCGPNYHRALVGNSYQCVPN